MSYGTFVWFKYDALKPLFDLNLTAADVPAEPLPQNSILHAIERLLIYIAWDQKYDFRISQNPHVLTPFIDNKQLNNREDLQPHTFVDFNQIGGIKGALKYIVIGPARAVKYILKKNDEESEIMKRKKEFNFKEIYPLSIIESLKNSVVLWGYFRSIFFF